MNAVLREVVNWLAFIGVINWWHRQLYQHGELWGESCFPRVHVDHGPAQDSKTNHRYQYTTSHHGHVGEAGGGHGREGEGRFWQGRGRGRSEVLERRRSLGREESKNRIRHREENRGGSGGLGISTKEGREIGPGGWNVSCL